MRIDVLFGGLSGRTSRGFLGWSSCLLIRREERPPVLFDTGGFNERGLLLEQLAGHGVRPGEIGAVVLSHFHFDHAANYGLFPHAACYMHELEIRHALDDRSQDVAVPREMFPALQDSGRLRVLSGEGGTADGLRWVHTPGHTPGLISLFLQCGGERWVLASDAVKSKHELVSGIASMTENYAASAASIAKIRRYADWVMPGHGGLLRLERANGEIHVHTVSRTKVDVTLYPSGDPRAAQVISLEG